MRALIVTGTYLSPGETFVNNHVENLCGGDTIVLCRKYTGDNPHDRPIHERKLTNRSYSDLVQAPLALIRNQREAGTIRVPFGSEDAGIRAFVARHRPDFMLCEFGHQMIAMAPIGLRLGLPTFGYFRGSDASKLLRRRHIVTAYRKTVPRLTGVFAVSQFLLNNLAAEGIANPNSHVIPSGVNTDHFVPGQPVRGQCVAVGRLVDKKNPQLTIRAFAKAARGAPDARLLVIGDGPLRSACEAEADASGAGAQISFLGQLPHDEVLGLLRSSELFLQHSVTSDDGDAEGLPTAIQEAMACGLAVLSTRHAGIPEAVIEGETGLLVDEQDEANFTRKLGEMLSGQHDLAALGAAGRRRAVESFDNRVLVGKLEATIRSALTTP